MRRDARQQPLEATRRAGSGAPRRGAAGGVLAFAVAAARMAGPASAVAPALLPGMPLAAGAAVAAPPGPRAGAAVGLQRQPPRQHRLELVGTLGAASGEERPILGPGRVLALSDDGRLAAASGGDEVVRVWTVGEESKARELRWRGEKVSALAVEGRGAAAAALLAVGSEGGAVAVFRFDNLLKPVRSFSRHRGEVAALAFADEGKHLLSGGGEDGAVRLWEVATGRPVRSWNSPVGSAVCAVAVLGGSGRVAVAGEAGLALFDARSGKRQLSVARPGLLAAAFAPDGGAALVATEDAAAHVALIDLASAPPKEIALLAGADEPRPRALAMTNERALALLAGAAAATGQAQTEVRVWSRTSGERVSTALAGGAGAPPIVNAVILGGSDAGGGDTGGGNAGGGDANGGGVWRALLGYATDVARWEIAKPPPERRADHAGAVEAIAVSGDGRRLLSGGRDGTARLWDLEAGQRPKAVHAGFPSRDVRAAAFAADAPLAAAADVAGRVRLLATDDGHEVAAFDGQRGLEYLALVDAGARLASASYDRMVLREVGGAAAAEIGSSRFPRVATGLAFSRDGRAALVALGPDVQMREVPGGKTIWSATDKDRWATAVALSPDEARAASCSRPRVREGGFEIAVWDARTGRRLASWPLRTVGSEAPVRLAFVGEDALAIASGEGLEIRDARTGREIARRNSVGVAGEQVTVLAAGPARQIIAGTSYGRLLRLELVEAVAAAPAAAGHAAAPAVRAAPAAPAAAMPEAAVPSGAPAADAGRQ